MQTTTHPTLLVQVLHNSSPLSRGSSPAATPSPTSFPTTYHHDHLHPSQIEDHHLCKKPEFHNPPGIPHNKGPSPAAARFPPHPNRKNTNSLFALALLSQSHCISSLTHPSRCLPTSSEPPGPSCAKRHSPPAPSSNSANSPSSRNNCARDSVNSSNSPRVADGRAPLLAQRARAGSSACGNLKSVSRLCISGLPS